jgi:hypothetical protein
MMLSLTFTGATRTMVEVQGARAFEPTRAAIAASGCGGGSPVAAPCDRMLPPWKRRSRIGGAIAVRLLLLVPASPAAAKTHDLYEEINAAGTLSVRITGPTGQPRCARLWWVKRLIGRVSQIGSVCRVRTLAIPTFLGISLASKLRGSAETGTTITVSARDRVARTVSFNI